MEKHIGKPSTKTTRTRIHMITKKQIAALKYMIIKTPMASDLLKQILILLILRSGRLTRDVRIVISTTQGYSSNDILEATNGLQEMSSCNGKTHLGALVHLIGSRLQFCWHNTTNQYGSLARRTNCCYTFWLAKKPYSKKARQVRVSKEILDGVNIRESGLYPHC